MIFDLGCCCIVGTGTYDFYGDRSVRETSQGFGLALSYYIRFEKDDIIARFSAKQSTLVEFASGQSSQINNVAVSGSRDITNYLYGKYVEFGSGTDLQQATTTMCSISPMTTAKEWCWSVRQGLRKYHSDEYPNLLYDILNGSGLSAPIISSGTGIDFTGNTLTLKTNDVTSGAYINIPITNTGVLNRIGFSYHNSYDKTILLKLETNSPYPHSGYDIWIRGGINPLGISSKFNYASQSGSGNNQIPVTWRPDVDSYITYVDSGDLTGLHIGHIIDFPTPIYIEPGIEEETTQGRRSIASGYPEYNNIQIRIVDDFSGYSIDDVSGFGIKIDNFYIGFSDRIVITGYNATHFDGVEFLSSVPYENYHDISLIDTENDELLYRYVPRTGNYLGNSITGTHFGIIWDLATGIGYGDTEWVGGRGATGHFREADLVGNRGTYLGVNVASTYLYSNLKKRRYEPAREHITQTTPGRVSTISRDVNNTSSDEMLTNRDGTKLIFTHISDRLNDGYQTTPATTINYKPFNSFAGGQQHYSYVYDVILEYDYISGLNFIFGESVHFDLVEYQWGMEAYNDYGEVSSITDYADIDVDNINNGLDLLKIQKWDAYNYPNCFSIKSPRRQFISTNGGSDTDRDIQSTVELYYGPYKKSILSTEVRTDNSSGYGFLDSDSFSPSFPPLLGGGGVGYLNTLNPHVIHGDEENSSLFWSDTYTTERAGTLVNALGMGTTGIALFGDTPHVNARIVYGCSKDDVPAAIFINARMDWNVTNSTGIHHFATEQIETGYSQFYCKVKIGDNIVFDKQIYGLTNLHLHGNASFVQSQGLIPAFGLVSLQDTESAQISNISGNTKAAFAWFETLYSGSPSFANTGNVPVTGYKLHITNISGQDIWTKSTSSYVGTGTGTYGSYSAPIRNYLLEKPRIVGSSDRYIYVSHFALDYPDVWILDTNTIVGSTGTVYTDESGFIRRVTYGDDYYVVAYGLSGLGDSFAFSHDNKAIMPIGHNSSHIENLQVWHNPTGGANDFLRNFHTFNIFKTKPVPYPTFQITELKWIENPFGIEEDYGENINIETIKNSNRFDDVPSYEEFVITQETLDAVKPRYLNGYRFASGTI